MGISITFTFTWGLISKVRIQDQQCQVFPAHIYCGCRIRTVKTYILNFQGILVLLLVPAHLSPCRVIRVEEFLLGTHSGDWVATGVVPDLPGLLQSLCFHFSCGDGLNLHKTWGLWWALSLTQLPGASIASSFLSPWVECEVKESAALQQWIFFSVIFVVASEDYLGIISVWGKLCSKSFLIWGGIGSCYFACS